MFRQFQPFRRISDPVVQLCLATAGMAFVVAVGMQFINQLELVAEALCASGMFMVGGFYLLLALLNLGWPLIPEPEEMHTAEAAPSASINSSRARELDLVAVGIPADEAAEDDFEWIGR